MNVNMNFSLKSLHCFIFTEQTLKLALTFSHAKQNLILIGSCTCHWWVVTVSCQIFRRWCCDRKGTPTDLPTVTYRMATSNPTIPHWEA